jgi:hypothetical protein
MVAAASAKLGRVAGIEVYDLDPAVQADASGELHAELVVRGIEHGDTSYEVRVFFNAPDADGVTPRTIDAGYAGHISVSGHGHHTSDDPARPRVPIDVKVDVTDAFRRALETAGGVESVTLVPTTQDTVTDALWKFAEFELHAHAEPTHGHTHPVDEFGSVTD